MNPSRARLIASSFDGDEGFKGVPFTPQLKGIAPKGKRSLFLKKKIFLKPPVISSLIAVFQVKPPTHNKEKLK